MSQRPSVFDLYLPGVVAGMIFAAVALTMGDAVLHDAFQKVFPRQTFLLLAVGIGTASTIGFANLLFPPSEPQSRDGFRSGGTDVL